MDHARTPERMHPEYEDERALAINAARINVDINTASKSGSRIRFTP